MNDQQIFDVISKNWPDKDVRNIESWIHQEYRDVGQNPVLLTDFGHFIKKKYL